MQWLVVQKRIRQIWPKIAKHMPERTKRGKGQLDYEDELVFEAALYMVRHNISMRNRLGDRYPWPNPLYLRLAAMVRSRVLDIAWAAYLKEASRAELKEWAEAFERIRQNRRLKCMEEGRREAIPAKGKGSKPYRTGLSPGLAWIEILLRGLEDACRSRGAEGPKKASGTKEWAACNVNIQQGCEHGCLYCYAHGNAGRFKRASAKSWTTPSRNLAAITRAYKKKHEKPVMFPSTHDITEANLADCLVVLKKLLAAGNQVLIVSKPHLKCVKVLCRELETHKDQILFRFTIGSADDTVLSFWEPHAPPYNERINSLKWAFKQGYKTSVSCEPMLDGDIQRVIDDARPFVADAIWLGRVNRLQNCLTLNASDNRLAKEKARALMELQNDFWVMGLYVKHKDDPLIKYKDSIKKVVGLERPEEAGLDV
jgi:DNA repair photolyase